MIDKLKSLLDSYDNCLVECDGFTRIASYLLHKADVKHRVLVGHALVPNAAGDDHDLVRPHFWIEVVDEDGLVVTVDYRLRCWCGDHAKHGVFYNDEFGVDYCPSKELVLEPNDTIFEILTLPSPAATYAANRKESK